MYAMENASMKTQIILFKTLVFFFLLIFCFNDGYAQEGKASLKSAIENKRFVFTAQTVLPTGGGMRQVSGENYDVRVFGDSLIAYLPYFGRAYAAPVGDEGGGIKFTSTHFDYSFKNKKKGGWEIFIKPKDTRDLREFMLSVSEKGYASLRAISNNRQPIFL
jgi:hypothetical protein